MNSHEHRMCACMCACLSVSVGVLVCEGGGGVGVVRLLAVLVGKEMTEYRAHVGLELPRGEL